MQIDGDAVLGFLQDIEKIMDDAGRKRHRAFELVHGLKELGIRLVRDAEPVVEAQTNLNLAHVEPEPV